MHAVSHVGIEGPTTELERRLRPQYAQVFRGLRDLALAGPGYATMQQIAEKGWSEDRRPSGTDQIKNNVQRAVYEIRMKLGPDIILNEGSTYRLNLVRLRQVAESGTGPQIQEQFGPFEELVKTLLRDAQKKGDCRRLIFWGNCTTKVLAQFSELLTSVVAKGRRVSIVCTDGRVGVDLLLAAIRETTLPLEDFIAKFQGLLEVFVVGLSTGGGAAWIDRAENESVVFARGPLGAAALVAKNVEVSAYLEALTSRLAIIQAGDPAKAALLVVDPFDLTLSKQPGLLWQYFQTEFDSAEEDTEPNPLVIRGVPNCSW